MVNINKKQLIFILTFIIILLISSCTKNQITYRETSIEKEQLIGSVKKMEHIFYGTYIDNNRFKNSDTLDNYYVISKKYNKNGMLEKESYYKENNNLYNESTYFYDEIGRLKKELYKYPNYGEIKRIISYSKNNLVELSEYIDIEGEVSRRYFIKYNKEGKAKSRNIVYNDSIDNLVNIDDSDISKRIEYKYNEDIKLVKETVFGSDEEIIYFMQYEYDKSGNNVLEKKVTQNGEIEYEIMKEYNENMDVVREVIKESGYEKNIEYEYEYDSIGNWINKSTKRNKIIIKKEVRNIEYYD